MVDVTDKAKKYKSVAYYPGCALEGHRQRLRRLDARGRARSSGSKLEEVKELELLRRDGGEERRPQDPDLSVLARAFDRPSTKTECDVVMAPCNGCYHNLKKAEYDLSHDRKSREVVTKLAQQGWPHAPTRPARSRPSMRSTGSRTTIGEEGLRERTKGSLAGLKVANYYGCMYTRPRHIFPEKDQGPGTRIDRQAAFHGRPPRGGGRRERRLPAQDRVLRRRAHALRQRHLDQARAQHPAGGRGVRRRGDRHRMPDLPHRVSRCIRCAPRSGSARRRA